MHLPAIIFVLGTIAVYAFSAYRLRRKINGRFSLLACAMIISHPMLPPDVTAQERDAIIREKVYFWIVAIISAAIYLAVIRYFRSM